MTRWFQLARKMSKHSNHQDHAIGCIIVRKNKILGMGYNKNKTSPKSLHPFRNIHGELSAVLNTGLSDLSGCEAYVYRERKDGSIGNSKPCIWCQQMFKAIGLRIINYTHEDGYKREML